MSETTKRTFVALAAVAVLGACGRQARAEGPGVHWLHSIPSSTGNSPDTVPALIPGMTALGPVSPGDPSGQAYWPCFTGGSDADCSNIPAGAMVIGIPYQNWPISNCNVPPGGAVCAELIWTYTSEKVNGKGTLSIVIRQGKNIVFDTGAIETGELNRDGWYYGYWFLATGPNACSAYHTACVDATAGLARVEVTLTFGTAKCVNMEPIVFQ